MSHPSAENPSPEQPTAWADSAWVWFGLFAAMGVIALVAVAPKYARRQGRLEQRYENRLHIEEQRRAAATGAIADATPNSTPTRMVDARATSSLRPIALVLLLFIAGAAFFVWRRTHRRQGLQQADSL